MKSQALEQVKANLVREAATNDAVAAKGGRAYHFGIERRNNPENLPSARTAWERGYDAARLKFEAMLARWKSL